MLHSYVKFPCFSPWISLRRRRPSFKIKKRRFRINEEITAAEVLVVSDGGSERMTREEALMRSRGAELDLVEINPKGDPPVCKIIDSGSHLYHLEKKERKQRMAGKQAGLKTVRIGFRTDRHDLDRQLGRAREFLAERRLVKVDLQMRGREFFNREYAREKMRKFVDALMDVAEVEQELKKQGNRLTVTLKPRK